MKTKKNTRLLLLSGALLALPVQAAGPVLTVQAGRSDETEMAGIGLRLSPWWTKDWGQFRLSAHPEFRLNQHFQRGSGIPGPGNLWQLAAYAGFRLTYGETGLRPYVEAGLGLTWLTKSALGDDRFGSRLHFGEFFGLGLQAGRFFGGWRISHYSNAGIREPNNGLDAQQIVLGVAF